MFRYFAVGALVLGAMMVAVPSQAGCCVKTSYTMCRKPCSLTIKPCKAPDWCKVGTPACCQDNMSFWSTKIPY